MAEDLQSNVCEEPDADFFDTFFDDGVLETIGQVLGTPGVNDINEDSSCSNSVPGSLPEKNLDSLTEPDIIILEAPQTQEGNGRHVREKSPVVKVNFDSDKTLSLPESKKQSTVESVSPHVVALSSKINDSRERENDPHSSIDELLLKVKQCLQNVQDLKVNKDKYSSGETQSSCSKVNDLEKEKEKLSFDVNLVKVSKTSCESENNLDMGVKKNKSSLLPTKTSTVTSDIKAVPLVEQCDESSDTKPKSGTDILEEGEILLSPGSSQDVPPVKDSSVSLELTASRDDTEKENDLISEETCSKTGGPTPVVVKKNAIQLNLKTQILASTTILNSETSAVIKSGSMQESINKLPSHSKESLPKAYKTKGSKTDNIALKEKNDERKRKRDGSFRRQSGSPTHDETSNWSSKERREKGRKDRKKKKRDYSPPLLNKAYKEPRSKYRRSRSRSASPSLLPRRQQRRVKSPDRVMYQKIHRRGVSRSPSKSPPRSYRRRYVRSPARSPARSRSRSRSSSQHSRPSRAKSRSPFMNEICRLKKQWEKEDEAKKSNQPSWSNETASSSTTYVSNMVSVQVHSTYTIGDAMDTLHLPYQAGLSPVGTSLTGPHVQNSVGNPIMQPQFNMYSDANGFPVPSSVFPEPPMVPGMEPSMRGLVPNFNYGIIPDNNAHISSLPFTSPYPPSFPLPPPPPPYVPQEDTVFPAQTEPQTSVLRKQLDILMSTVIGKPLGGPQVSSPRKSLSNFTDSSNHSLVKITCEPISSSSSCTTSQFDGPLSSGAENFSKETSTSANLQPVPLNAENCENRTSSSANKLTSGVAANVGNEATTNDRHPTLIGALTCDSQLTASANESTCGGASSLENNDIHDKKLECPKASNDSKSLPSSPCELTKAIDDKDVAKTEGSLSEIHSLETESISGTELDDSDVIIEEPSSRLASEAIDGKDVAKVGVSMSEIHSLQTESISGTELDDSDIIIEEPPPKTPPPLICLSDDDADEIYNLDVELDKIHNDIATNQHQISTDPCNKKPQRKRGRNKKKRKREQENKKKKSKVDERRRKSSGEEDQEKCPDHHDTVLRECREMIDTLRIGRFFVTAEDNALQPQNPVVPDNPNSSLLSKRERVEFSFSKNTNPEEVPKFRDQSTNTQKELCFDVCTTTESFVTHKDCMNQTELECLGCIEKMVLIKEMSNNLMQVKKQRDALLARVHDLEKSRPIPGLESIEGEGRTSSYLPTESQSLTRINASSFNVGWSDQQTAVEPIVAYEYNHSSPERCPPTNFFVN